MPFEHSHSAHCESGVITSLLRHQGLNISEPMAFGISGALTMAYIPFLKIGGMPLIGYRMPPKSIIRGLAKRLGIKMHTETFRSRQAGMNALDRYLQDGRPVGLQTSVYWLPYFPAEMRFHFNAHNLVVFGKSDNEYLISDPTLEQPVSCDATSLKKARFVKGMMSPKGLIYYPTSVPDNVDLKAPILSAIRANTKMMLKTPIPLVGIKGIRTLSKAVRKLGAKHDNHTHQNKLFLGHIVRMQEEIGTGGAGFRFLYASFLQEAAPIVDDARLQVAATMLTNTGDEWRSFALHAAKMCKGRMDMDYDKLADQLLVCAEQEEEIFLKLSKI
ncbi:MAG: peptidase [Gammaproteobacteria bacterium]|nr:MAG: peptidase [Gammaproteobacteria bacterium]